MPLGCRRLSPLGRVQHQSAVYAVALVLINIFSPPEARTEGSPLGKVRPESKIRLPHQLVIASPLT